MDVDDFLDRELSGLATDRNEKQKPDASVPKDEFDRSPIFESIRSNLSRGDLDGAEKSYVKLWDVLAQQKLKWNREIYEQLAAASKQFSGMLSQAHDDIKRKASQTYEMVSRARTALKDGKKEQPFKIYSEIQDISGSIPNSFFEEKKIMQEQIMDFYKELKGTTDNELIKRVYVLVGEITRLIERINGLIRSRDMAGAAAEYSRCMDLYNQIPEGFLRHKNSMGMRLLDIYKSLSIYNEISSLQKQLSQQQAQRPLERLQAPDQVKKYLSEKKERAKRNIAKGFYDAAINDIQDVLKLDPKDPEAKVLHAKIKTLS